jgi:DNA-binding XRE family transcriptional regulator
MGSEQIKAARALLRWTKTELATRARIDRRTVANLEADKHVPSMTTLTSIRRAFASAGIEFIDNQPHLKNRIGPVKTDKPSPVPTRDGGAMCRGISILMCGDKSAPC